MKAVIGALRAVLGLETASFEKGIGIAQKELTGLNRSFQKTAKQLEAVGEKMTASITAPLLALKAVGTAIAGNFEQAMNKVQAATQASASEFKGMQDAARTMAGAFSSTEIASAMEALAKNGLNVAQIMGGATKATVDLAAANDAQLGPAADAVTDIMNNFGKRADELSGVVNHVTGTLFASKFAFDDYRLALGQAGGVAGNLGVTLEDFNASLALTSSAFSSGSDAGTSFKTFLQRLVPQSKEATEMMAKLGLKFFDAKGAMLPMPQIAERLRAAMKGLSDEGRSKALVEIFGTDAIRTALILAREGAAGFQRMASEISKVSAADQAAVRLRGLNGAMREFKTALEQVAISIGNSGLLEHATRMTQRMTELARSVANLSPAMLRTGTVIAAAAAAAGPLLLVLGKVIGMMGSVALAVGRAVPIVASLMTAFMPLARIIVMVGAATAAVLLFGDEIAVSANGAISLNDALKGLLATVQSLWADIGPLLTRMNEIAEWFILAPKLIDRISENGSRLWKSMTTDASEFSRTVMDVAGFLDQIVGAFVGAYNVIVATWKSIPGVITEFIEDMAGKVLKAVTEWINAVIKGLNWVREKIGREKIPPLPVIQFQTESQGAFERAGVALAEAFNKGFSTTVFSEAVKRGLDAAAQSAFARAINNLPQQPVPPPVSQRELGGRDPSPTARGQGGAPAPTVGGGGGGSNPTEKLREYIRELERQAQTEAMVRNEKELSDAMHRAEVLARERGIALSQAERAEIEKNITAIQAARKEGEEKRRLDDLAKDTVKNLGGAQAQYNRILEDLKKLLESGRITQEQFTQAQRQAQVELSEANKGFEYRMKRFSDAIGDAAKDTAREIMRMDGNWRDALGNMGKRLAEFAVQILIMEPLLEGLGSLLKSVLNDIFSIQSSGGGGGGGGGIFGSIFGSIFSGIAGGAMGGSGSSMQFMGGGGFGGAGAMANFAEGGRPQIGRWSVIGEEGPEIWRPDTAGRVIPFSDLASEGRDAGGGGGFVQHNTFSANSPAAMRQVVREMLPEIAEASHGYTLAKTSRGGASRRVLRGRT